MSTKFGLLIDFDLLKAAISISTKPEIVFSVRGHHLDKVIWRYISAVAAPNWTKLGKLMQNKIQITGKWSRWEPEVEFQHGGRLFFETRSRYISAINWYMLTTNVDEIWFVDRFWPSDGKYINKYETGSSMSHRGRHLEKSTWRHISAVVNPERRDNNGDEVKIETEKSDGLKARNFSLVVQACKPACYSDVRGCVLAGVEQLYTGNLLTVVLAHYTHS